LSGYKVLIIVGPTAVGKTALSLSIAEVLGCEIVSADSRQVYQYMDIGTAKPTRQELSRIPHHFIDIRQPDQYYSAGEYGREARVRIAVLHEKEITPVVVGGSGFYIQALVDGLFAPKISDPEIKQRWRDKVIEQGQDAVFNYLKQVDPVSAERLHPNDTQRVVRALEVYELSGKPISAFKKGEETPADFTPVFIGLNRERGLLYKRIEQRVDLMIESGLVDEVKRLREKGWGPELNALKTVGYQEVYDYFDGNLTFEEMIEKIKITSRRYAKRQLTWFRRDRCIHWVELDNISYNQAVKKILEIAGL